MRSGKQFLRFVAESLGIRGSDQVSFELYEQIRNELAGSKTPLFFDRAELLTKVPLQMVLEIVEDCQIGSILSSSSRVLLERIERVDESEKFMSYCSFYCPNVRPTRKLRELQNAAGTYGVPPTLKFPIH